MALTVKNLKIPKTSSSSDDDGKENGDTLTSLPEPIIHHIFSFLETIDVVRASAVSKKWRYLWVSMPYLNFNIHTIWRNRQEGWSLQTINEKFKDFISWVLMFQDSSTDIQRFHLRCFSFSDDHTIQRWLNVVSRRNVKRLNLSLVSDHTPIQLPRCVFNSQSLVALKVKFEGHRRCVVKLPHCPGFSKLKSLHLQMVEFLDSDLLGNFISNCPVLEKLKIKSCYFGDFKTLNISSTSLNNLIVNFGDFPEPDCDGLDNCMVKIACPSLVTLQFITSSTWNFTFQDLNSLQDAFLFYYFPPEHATAEECHRVMSKIIDGLGDVHVLKLAMGFLMFLNQAVAKTECFLGSFYSLKSLTVCICLNWYKQVEPIINLLNLSPNLEALTIFIDWMEWIEDWNISDKVTCSAHYLKSVRLIHFGDSNNELELVKFLLKKGLVLEKLSIYWLEGVEEYQRIIQEINKFPTSSNVLLAFFDPTSESFFDF